MINQKTLMRIAGFTAALLVNVGMFVAAGYSIDHAGPLLINDDPVVRLEPVVVTADRPARTAATPELSRGRSL